MTHDDDLRARRLATLEIHFKSEVDHDWDACLATFDGHPRYEIMPTGQVHDGDEQVLAYHCNQRIAFPDQHHENLRIHVGDDDTVITEFDLVGTNTGEFVGRRTHGQVVPCSTIAVFFFEDDRITNERVYLDAASMVRQIGRTDLLG